MSGAVPFLLQVARTYMEKEEDSLKDYCFVFPNRRSSLFFRRYLLQVSRTPVFCPELTDISALFESLSDLKKADDIFLLYQLYLSYKACVPGYSDTFDDFIRWGDSLRNDFDDIDKYLADARGLFDNLSDLKKLDDGTFSYLTDAQRKAVESFWGTIRAGKSNSDSFLGVWNCLWNVYDDYRKRLRKQGVGYEGMISRDVAENISSVRLKWKRVVFVGLNALNACESALMDALRKEGRADFYWDWCGALMKDPENRASLFMDENLRRYPSLYPLPDESPALPEITVTGVSSAVGQAKCLPAIIGELGPESINELSTCVVLPDPSLLLPVLTSVPGEIDTINVTMGYPLKESGVAFLMAQVAALQLKSRKKDGETLFYHISAVNILDHPFVRKAAGDAAAEVRTDILRKHIIYVPSEVFSGNEFLGTVFSSCPAENPAGYLCSVLEKIREVADDLDREYIYHYISCVRKLEALHPDVRLNTWFSILERIVRGISVPLSGEPLSGLQIMGPLETRAIDFKNLIILSMNEGKFPAGSIRDSMIPYNLRRGFGLPTYEIQDAIGAYHFYRSLARAEKVFLLYDTRAQSLGGSEESRYIKQLKYHHRLDMRYRTALCRIGEDSALSSVPALPKTDGIIRKLRELNYSASSLLSYLTCGMQFYYGQVCGLREEEQVEDNIDSGTFGSIFHKVMEILHKPFEGALIGAKETEWMKSRLPEAINKSFAEVTGMAEIRGRNVIIAELIRKYALSALDADRKNLPIVYIKSEKKSGHRVTAPSGVKLNVYGIIDRLDKVEGVFRIVDYKTGGRIYMKYGAIEDLFGPAGEDGFARTAFQLLYYLFLLRENGDIPEGSPVRMEVVHTPSLFKGGAPQLSVSDEEYLDFRSGILNLLDEILNPEVPFTAAESDTPCKCCQFRILCHR